MRLIDADKIHYIKCDIMNPHIEDEFKEAIVVFAKEIDKAPTVDAEPVLHGTWQRVTCENNDGATWNSMACSACKDAGYKDPYILAIFEPTHNYCPQCGAKMEM